MTDQTVMYIASDEWLVNKDILLPLKQKVAGLFLSILHITHEV